MEISMSLEAGVEYGIADYIEDQAAYDALTDEQVQALSRGELVKFGETEPAPAAKESDDAPAVATEEKKPAEAVVEVPPVIATKDGKHVIPFQELQDARDREAQLKSVVEAQATLIESLKTAKVEDTGTGKTDAQDDVLAKFVSEYPELAPSLTPAIQKMIEAGVNAKVSELEKKFAETIAPMQKTAMENSEEAHFAAITKAIPDFHSIVDSGEIHAWVEKLPSYVRESAEKVLEKGTAQKIIELFSDYKASLPAGKTAEPGLSKEEIEKKAAAAVAAAKGRTPSSLSEVASGTNAEIDSDAAEATMSPQQLYAKMQNMDPNKILAHLSKAI
jgi:hypothetical protein